jgi:hypothetical protein
MDYFIAIRQDAAPEGWADNPVLQDAQGRAWVISHGPDLQGYDAPDPDAPLPVIADDLTLIVVPSQGLATLAALGLVSGDLV